MRHWDGPRTYFWLVQHLTAPIIPPNLLLVPKIKITPCPRIAGRDGPSRFPPSEPRGDISAGTHRRAGALSPASIQNQRSACLQVGRRGSPLLPPPPLTAQIPTTHIESRFTTPSHSVSLLLIVQMCKLMDVLWSYRTEKPGSTMPYIKFHSSPWHVNVSFDIVSLPTGQG